MGGRELGDVRRHVAAEDGGDPFRHRPEDGLARADRLAERVRRREYAWMREERMRRVGRLFVEDGSARLRIEPFGKLGRDDRAAVSEEG